MKRVAINDLKKGDIIGENIKDKSGKLLVGVGTAVTQTIIMRLEDNGIKSLMILEEGEKYEKNNEESEGLKFLEGLKNKFGTIKNINSAIREKIEKEEKKENEKLGGVSLKREQEIKRPVVVVKKVVKTQNKEVKNNDDAEQDKFLKETNDTVKKIILETKEQGAIIPLVLSEEILRIFNSILVKKDILNILMKMKNYDNYLYEHALYCGLIGMIAGELFDYPKIAIFSLGMGGLLMDSGMIEIPKEIIDKKAVLKPDEREIVKTHTMKSHVIACEVSQITDIAKEIVLNHHERVDGTGYPKGKKCDEISDYTKLMTIIDVYHALISERPYHQKKNSKEAFYTIFMYKGKQFDEKILAEIIKKRK